MKKEQLFSIARRLILFLGVGFLILGILDLLSFLFWGNYPYYFFILSITIWLSYFATMHIDKNLSFTFFGINLVGLLFYLIIGYYYLDSCSSVILQLLWFLSIFYFLPVLVITILFFIHSKTSLQS